MNTATNLSLPRELLRPVLDFLACATPQAWIEQAVQDIPMLLQDHANCEKKAASTAMKLMYSYGYFTE